MKTYHIASYSKITPTEFSVNGDKMLLRNPESQDLWLHDIYRALNMNYPKFFKMDKLCKSGILAAEPIMQNFMVKPDEIKTNWAIIGMNSVSSLDDDTEYQATIQNENNYFPSPSVFVYTLANIVIGELAIKYKIQGETSFYIEQLFNTQSFIINVIKTFEVNPQIEYALCGWINYYEENCDVMMMVITTNPDKSILEFNETNINQIYY